MHRGYSLEGGARFSRLSFWFFTLRPPADTFDYPLVWDPWYGSSGWLLNDPSPIERFGTTILPLFSTFDPPSYNILSGAHAISLISPLPHAHQNICAILPFWPHIGHWHQWSSPGPSTTVILIKTECSHATLADGLGSSSSCLPENCLPPRYNRHVEPSRQMPNDRLCCTLHHFSRFCNLVDDTHGVNIIWHLQLQSYFEKYVDYTQWMRSYTVLLKCLAIDRQGRRPCCELVFWFILF